MEAEKFFKAYDVFVKGLLCSYSISDEDAKAIGLNLSEKMGESLTVKKYLDLCHAEMTEILVLTDEKKADIFGLIEEMDEDTVMSVFKEQEAAILRWKTEIENNPNEFVMRQLLGMNLSMSMTHGFIKIFHIYKGMRMQADGIRKRVQQQN